MSRFTGAWPSVNPCRSLKNPSGWSAWGTRTGSARSRVQAGLSEATVDRVLNGRGGVRASTVAEVHQAIDDLHRQRTQLRLAGRTFVVDLVVDAPAPVLERRAGRAGGRAARASGRPSSARGSTSREAAPVAEIVATLDRIATRGSQGVVLKAPDDPRVVAAVERLVGAGIPVVTLRDRPAHQPARWPTSASTTGPPARRPRT